MRRSLDKSNGSDRGQVSRKTPRQRKREFQNIFEEPEPASKLLPISEPSFTFVEQEPESEPEPEPP